MLNLFFASFEIMWFSDHFVDVACNTVDFHCVELLHFRDIPLQSIMFNILLASFFSDI